MRSKRLELKLSDDLLIKIDEAAQANYESRSAYIRKSIVLRLNGQSITNNQNDQEKWQAIIDQPINLPSS